MFSHQVWTDRYILSTSEDSRQVWPTSMYYLYLYFCGFHEDSSY